PLACAPGSSLSRSVPPLCCPLPPPPPPGPSRFPYTTLFRSRVPVRHLHAEGRPLHGRVPGCHRQAPRRPRGRAGGGIGRVHRGRDRKSTRLNSSHVKISYAVFCLKKKGGSHRQPDRTPCGPV